MATKDSFWQRKKVGPRELVVHLTFGLDRLGLEQLRARLLLLPLPTPLPHPFLFLWLPDLLKGREGQGRRRSPDLAHSLFVLDSCQQWPRALGFAQRRENCLVPAGAAVPARRRRRHLDVEVLLCVVERRRSDDGRLLDVGVVEGSVGRRKCVRFDLFENFLVDVVNVSDRDSRGGFFKQSHVLGIKLWPNFHPLHGRIPAPSAWLVGFKVRLTNSKKTIATRAGLALTVGSKAQA